MLDPTRQWRFPELPDVLVFGDDRLSNGFYALAYHPSVASDEAGALQLDLTLYGRGTGSGFVPTGGLLTVTVELAVPAARRPALTAALARLLAGRAELGCSDAPPPQLLAVDWLEGEVELKLLPDLMLHGRPSLSGGNRTSFTAKLDAAQAKALHREWQNGLPQARVRYAVRLRAAPGATQSHVEFGATSSSTRRDAKLDATATLRMTASVTPAAPPFTLTAEGPLLPSGAGGRLTLVTF